MKPSVTLMAPGGMGAAIGARLVEHGLTVSTCLTGRSEASVARARSAGLIPVDEAGMVASDLFLSVVPPDQALPLARRIASLVRSAGVAPLYVDCNAINPQTAAEVATVVEAAGCAFVDGGLIGLPPTPGGSGPKLFVSGPQARHVAALGDHGLSVVVLDGPVGAASALKMSYAGITKGIIAIGSAMILAAERAGAGAALRDELANSQARLLDSFGRSIPDMFPKARRWVPEMNEIAGFVAGDPAAQQIFDGFAGLYRRLAGDSDGERLETDKLARFFGPRPEGRRD